MFAFLCLAYFIEHNVLPLLPHVVNDSLSFSEEFFSSKEAPLLYLRILDGLLG